MKLGEALAGVEPQEPDPKDAKSGVVLLVEPSVRLLEHIDALCEEHRKAGRQLDRGDALLAHAALGAVTGQGVGMFMGSWAWCGRRPRSGRTRPREPEQERRRVVQVEALRRQPQRHGHGPAARRLELARPPGRARPRQRQPKRPRLGLHQLRLAELVHVNGSPNVRGWGFISSGNRLYGRFGLEQNEAMSLMSQWAFATGWCEGQPEPQEAFDELAKAIDETWKAREASLPPEPAPVEQTAA